jgi:hypothetical protein
VLHEQIVVDLTQLHTAAAAAATAVCTAATLAQAALIADHRCCPMLLFLCTSVIKYQRSNSSEQ